MRLPVPVILKDIFGLSDTQSLIAEGQDPRRQSGMRLPVPVILKDICRVCCARQAASND
jgi:hypothetical protein